jgi:hypothetical protein
MILYFSNNSGVAQESKIYPISSLTMSKFLKTSIFHKKSENFMAKIPVQIFWGYFFNRFNFSKDTCLIQLVTGLSTLFGSDLIFDII